MKTVLAVTLGLLGVGLATVLWSRSQAAPAAVAPRPTAPLAEGPLRLLVVGDPFARALQAARADLEALGGGVIQLEVVGYADMHQRALLNARDATSAYDLISIDSVWTGEFGDKGLVQSLDELLATEPAIAPDDFLGVALRAHRHASGQLGLPIQSHPELLWYRKDLLEAAGLPVPTTTNDLLTAAERLTDRAQGRYGIAWNGQRGQALGQQMAHFYGAFGRPVVDIDGRPAIDTPEGLAAARFALALLPYSPPDVLAMAWDSRPQALADGRVAMVFEWAARSALVEEAVGSPARGHLGYAAAPHAPGVAPATSMGSWALAIPANIGPRAAAAKRALVWLTGREVLAHLSRHGGGGAPRRSLMDDPELVRRYPPLPVVIDLDRRHELDLSARPPIPQWEALCDILGTVFHDMLEGNLTPEAATAEAQRQADALFRRPGEAAAAVHR